MLNGDVAFCSKLMTAQATGEVDTTEDDSKPTPSPGWKLALDKVNAELRATQQECTTLQKENSRLQEELVDCLPERNARKKALKQVHTSCLNCAVIPIQIRLCARLLLLMSRIVTNTAETRTASVSSALTAHGTSHCRILEVRNLLPLIVSFTY